MSYDKGKLLKDGGEGFIYEVQNRPDLLMKIYKNEDVMGSPIVTPELTKKLVYMQSNPPSALIEAKTVAWPLDLIRDSSGKLQGFVMPKMNIDENLLRAYSYRHPEIDAGEYTRFPSVSSRISLAINLCSTLNELHKSGYIIGDFNHANIGVNYKTGQVCLVDCDSFHITKDGNEVLRTNVIMAGYLAPEIIQHCNNERAAGRPYNLDEVALPTFTRESDLFCLAIHIFKLLMNGVDPFRGIKTDAVGSTAAPFVGNEAIERNAYVFKDGNKPSAVFCPPAHALPPEMLLLFKRAFVESRANPNLRPVVADWYSALHKFLTEQTVKCTKTEKHVFIKTLPECPYCEADRAYLKSQERFHARETKESLGGSASEIIRVSKKATRKLHVLMSLSLWGSAAVIYFVVNYLAGNREWGLNPAYWSGYEFLFLGAAFIECLIEIFFCRKERAVLNDNIDLREIDPKDIDTELRDYKDDLENKIRFFAFLATAFLIAFTFFVVRFVQTTHLNEWHWEDHELNSYDFDSDFALEGSHHATEVVPVAYVTTTVPPAITSPASPNFVERHWFDFGYYTGDWDNGLPHGQGRIDWFDGGFYEGDWVHGVRTGRGTFYWGGGGSTYTGEFLNGAFHGWGVDTWSDGEVHEGWFAHGVPHGWGRRTYPDGWIWEGTFSDGHKQEEARLNADESNPAFVNIGGFYYSTSMTTLQLSNMGLRNADIALLRYMTNLEWLCLSRNEISDLTPIAGLTNLEHLQIAGNTLLSSSMRGDGQISDLTPLSGLHSLRHLHLFGNQISDLRPLSNLTNLTYLHIGSNNAIDLTPLSSMANLEQLVLFGNQISDLSPLSSLFNLDHLSASSNPITDWSSVEHVRSVSR